MTNPVKFTVLNKYLKDIIIPSVSMYATTDIMNDIDSGARIQEDGERILLFKQSIQRLSMMLKSNTFRWGQIKKACIDLCSDLGIEDKYNEGMIDEEILSGLITAIVQDVLNSSAEL